MKKIKLTILTCLAVGIGFYSCKKENNEPIHALEESTSEELITNRNQGIQLTANGDFLIFSQVADYEYYASTNFTLEEFETFYQSLSSLDYTSQVDNIENGGSNIFGNDFLNNILSIDQSVQIGDNIYRLNEEDELVYVLPVNNSSDYQDLLNEDLSNANIKVFSYEDDVIELVELGDEGIAKGLFCKDRKAVEKSKQSSTINIPDNNIDSYLFIEYDNSGIYKDLYAVGYISKWANTQFESNTEYVCHFQLDNCSYKPRCKTGVSGYSHPWRNGDPTYSGTSLMDAIGFNFYRGTKNLKEYNFKVRFRIENWNEPIPGVSSYTVYFTPYITISDS